MSDTLTDVLKWNDALKQQLAVNAQIKEDLFRTLQNIHDEADHALHTEAEIPAEVVQQNMKTIFTMARLVLDKYGKLPK